MFIRIWKFRPQAGHEAAFLALYGAEGDWSELFGRSGGFLGTELVRTDTEPYEYMTIDRWKDRESWDRFLDRFWDEYSALDDRCDAVTAEETEVGCFVLAVSPGGSSV